MGNIKNVVYLICTSITIRCCTVTVSEPCTHCSQHYCSRPSCACIPCTKWTCWSSWTVKCWLVSQMTVKIWYSYINLNLPTSIPYVFLFSKKPQSVSIMSHLWIFCQYSSPYGYYLDTFCFSGVVHRCGILWYYENLIFQSPYPFFHGFNPHCFYCICCCTILYICFILLQLYALYYISCCRYSTLHCTTLCCNFHFLFIKLSLFYSALRH